MLLDLLNTVQQSEEIQNQQTKIVTFHIPMASIQILIAFLNTNDKHGEQWPPYIPVANIQREKPLKQFHCQQNNKQNKNEPNQGTERLVQ